MFCQVAQRTFSDLSASIDQAAIDRRLPYMGALELTYRCNLSCRHCYCNLSLNDPRKADELSTAEIKRLLDEAANAGCFWLLLTGGEVLVRQDFGEIYLHSLKKGMLVQVFTNATLIDEKTAARFAEFPPVGLDISFYGSTASLHDAITGVKGSFAKMAEGIAWLKKYKVKFSLKTILITLNQADLANMRLFAQKLGVEFRYDTLICPRTDEGTSPLNYRLSAEVMAGLDINEDLESCERIFSGFWNKKPQDAPACGAGVFAFNINPYGVLSPCTMFRTFQYPLKEVSFVAAWKRLVNDYSRKCAEFVPSECKGCSMFLICSNCPAWSELEAGSSTAKVDYICEYAKCLEQKFFAKKESEYGKEALSETGDQGSKAYH
jgi:radical SAM protein with 4Fe4S-binding SPASM domain